MTTPYIDPNLIFAENAPVQDKPAEFQNYDKGWDESRNNDGRPTIRQFNFLQQQSDLKIRYIHESGAALPYKDGIAYEENAVVVKDGVLQQWKGGVWSIPSLGLGTAAFKDVGTSTGNVMEVGAFGLGGTVIPTTTQPHSLQSGAFVFDGSQPNLPSGHDNGFGTFGINIARGGVGAFLYMPYNGYQNNFIFRTYDYTGVTSYRDHVLRDSRNTTVDSNGFIKAASPIVQLFADKIELNDEAQQQEITFEKLGVGDYLIKGSTGFSQDGWYVETPKDANGNLLVAVVYEQLENGDISVKTYDYMLNNKGRIVADIETPLDIPEKRWIDLRLQELASNTD